MKFQDKIKNILREHGEGLFELSDGCGVDRSTLYRKNKTRRATIAAIAYYFLKNYGITAEELVEGTEMEDVWYS